MSGLFSVNYYAAIFTYLIVIQRIWGYNPRVFFNQIDALEIQLHKLCIF